MFSSETINSTSIELLRGVSGRKLDRNPAKTSKSIWSYNPEYYSRAVAFRMRRCKSTATSRTKSRLQNDEDCDTEGLLFTKYFFNQIFARTDQTKGKRTQVRVKLRRRFRTRHLWSLRRTQQQEQQQQQKICVSKISFLNFLI